MPSYPRWKTASIPSHNGKQQSTSNPFYPSRNCRFMLFPGLCWEISAGARGMHAVTGGQPFNVNPAVQPKPLPSTKGNSPNAIEFKDLTFFAQHPIFHRLTVNLIPEIVSRCSLIGANGREGMRLVSGCCDTKRYCER